ncbi:hypothetical protein [Leeuwenhoekiella sp. NPDC079379]|uniref:hypothetical protein n=1 Tax=Leeuwenhoekiella sp. NPDC079379 TaxID=3364122 RepID=UPI0037C7ED29
MKKLPLILFLSIFSWVNASATTDPKPEAASAVLRNQIINLLGTPELDLQDELLESTIQFIVTAQKTIVVLNVTTESAQLENYIKNRLNYKKTEIEVTGNRMYYLPFKIKKG